MTWDSGLIKAFKQTLEAQGWMDGQNVQFDERWAQGDAKRIAALAAEMMSATPDVILAVATPVLVASVSRRELSRWYLSTCPTRGRRLCGNHGAAGRQHHWLHQL